MTVTTLKDPKDHSINRRFFRRCFELARPYWTRSGAWQSWLILGICLAFTALEVALGARLSLLTGQMSDALVDRQEISYWKFFILITLIGLVINGGVISHIFSFVSDRLTLHWRIWMTRDLTRRYLGGRAYFQIEQDGDIDNVDQRIQQEPDSFCQMAIYLPRTATYFILGVVTQSWILTSITPTLLWGVLLYGLANAAITIWLYRPIIRLSFDATMTEADLRFGFLHIRNYAETIALYRGEQAESISVNTRLKGVLRVVLARLRYDLIMRTTQTGVGLVWTLLPVLILVPLYFSGEITFGKITEATASAALLLDAISRLTDFIPMFASAAPSVVRLAHIVEKAQSVEHDTVHPQPMIQFRFGRDVQIDRLTLQTPGQERTLLREVSLILRSPDHLGEPREFGKNRTLRFSDQS